MAWIASEHPQVGGEEPSPDFEPSAEVGGGAVDDGTVAAPTQLSTQKAASQLRRRII